tara:strand:- start:330 stop:557 length:228 start_codon:yes stop_codon:yes gene_type:complete
LQLLRAAFYPVAETKKTAQQILANQQKPLIPCSFFQPLAHRLKCAFAILAQLAEQRFCKPQVISSSLINGFNKRR